MGSALVIPFRGLEGDNGYCRLKPDTPRRNQNGKPIKYESPKSRPNQVFIPPNTFRVLSDPTAELLITEGEKKAAKADQDGFRCLGLVGVFGWKDRKSERLLPDLERIALRGRQVRIVFDSDLAVKPEVLDAESRLAVQLKNHGAIVRVVRLPDGPNGEKVGLDDFLVDHGSGELRKLLDTGDDPEPVDPGSAKVAAADLDAYPEARRFLSNGFTLEGTLTIRHWNGEYYAWDGRRYVKIPDIELQAAVLRFLEPGVFKLNRSVVGNIVACIAAETIVPSRVELPSWLDGTGPWPADELIVTKSGLVHLPSLVANRECILPLTPRLFSTSGLDYSFDPNARCDTWLQFLGELWPDDPQAIATLQELFGYCLTPDTRQQKIFMLVGPKRSGKSTIARVLRGVVGLDNVAGPTLASLGSQFSLWPLLDKSLAIISDARLSRRSDEAIVVERLLSISGEDAQTVDRKYLAPITTRLKTRLLILTNELPRVSDASGALPSRMIVLHVTKSFFGREDPTLTDRLLQELPGILLWAIRGWQRLNERGHFEVPESSRELAAELEDLASPVGAFVREYCIIGKEHEVSVRDIYIAWCGWCDEHGRREPGTEQLFGRDLRAAVPNICVRQPRDGAKRSRVYQGIGLNSDGGQAAQFSRPHLARDGTRSYR
jgi:putative DNA primase/helicase